MGRNCAVEMLEMKTLYPFPGGYNWRGLHRMAKPLKIINLATNFQVKHALIPYSDKCYILGACEARIQL